MTELAAPAVLAPYLPRLVRAWPAGESGPLALDGTLVSVDISGFTALSERLAARGRVGAEELILLISRCFDGLIGVAEHYGGDVLKFRGDALLILFTDTGHEERGCRAASGMQSFIEAAGRTTSSVGPVELSMAAGVHTGECHFFVVESSHRELLVTGPAATATYRLEDAASSGEILVSRPTAAALPRAWLGEERDEGVLVTRLELEEPAEFAEMPHAEQLEDFVPAPLRAHLAVASGEAEHRHVSVAFVKFSEVDAVVAEQGPDALFERLQALAATAGDACSRFGVTWLESDIDVDGGKIYLTSGAPASSGSDEEGLLRALRAILDAGLDLPIRAGATRGLVFAGDIGAATRRTYAVMGDAVNLAARLTARAGVGELLVTRDLLDRSRTSFETERQPFLVKGKEQPIDAYRVGAATGIRAAERAAALPLIDRDRELEAIRAAVDAARMRQQQLVELVGEPGIGKSRLVEELRMLALGFAPFEAAAEQYARSVPFFSFRGLLRQLVGITPDQPRDAAGAQLAPWVQAVMPDVVPWLPLLAIPFDAEVPPTTETEGLDPQASRDRLHDAVEQLLQRVLMMPTLLVFEDAHWMDDSSRFLLGHLTSKPALRPWLVVVTQRPEGEAFVRPEGSGARLALEPLGDEAAASLALAAAAEFALSEEALSALAERSGGNPLFVRELVAAARGGAEVETLPETVETLLTTRIDMLPPSDKMLLRYASVVGPRFELDVLGEVLAAEIADAGSLSRWDRLAEFVRPVDENALGFVHDLVRATAYEGLSFRRRREIHGRVGLALERRAGAHVAETAALLSLHFHEAGEEDRAWHYAVLAGEQAQAKYANVVAAELYQRALVAAERLPDLGPSEIARVSEALGDVCERFAAYERADAGYEHARALLEADVLAQARLLLKQGDVREHEGRYEEALDRYGRGLADLDARAEDSALSARAPLELGCAGVLYRQGHYDQAIEWGRRAAEHARQASDRSTLAHTYYVLDAAYTDSGTDRDADYLERALPLYEELGDFRGQGRALNNLGVRHYYEGHWQEALDCYMRSREAKLRAGDVAGAAVQTNNVAEILSDQGQLEPAEELLREALRTFRAAGYRWGVGVVTANLGRSAARSGRFEDAQELLGEARDLLVELGSERYVAECDARLAESFVLAGRYREAEEAARTARTAAETFTVGGLQALVERLLGYALHQGRRPDEARPHFEESLRLAREADAPYEIALTLKAMAETRYPGGEELALESRELLDRLGVVSVPTVPLP